VQQLRQEYSDREAFSEMRFYAWNNVSAKLINYTPIPIEFLVDGLDDIIYWESFDKEPVYKYETVFLLFSKLKCGCVKNRKFYYALIYNDIY